MNANNIVTRCCAMLMCTQTPAFVCASEPGEFVEQLIAPDSPIESRMASDALFSTIDDAAGFSLLLRHGHENVALRAAWARLIRAVPSSDHERLTQNGLSQLAVERFLGFVEGRLEIEVPPWWEAMLKSCHANDSGHFFFDDAEKGSYWLAPLGYYVSQKVTMATEEEAPAAVVITLDDGRVVVLDDILNQRSNSGYRYISAATYEETAFVVLHSQASGPSRLYCIDSSKADPVWECGVWGSGGLLMEWGPSHHTVQCVVRDDRVYVFGGGHVCMYVECFRISDGKDIFRFNTLY